jgi:hypothetical protein
MCIKNKPRVHCPQKRWMISLLIMKCRKHSYYGMKSFIPFIRWNEKFHFIINNEITVNSGTVLGGVPNRVKKKLSLLRHYKTGFWKKYFRPLLGAFPQANIDFYVEMVRCQGYSHSKLFFKNQKSTHPITQPPNLTLL